MLPNANAAEPTSLRARPALNRSGVLPCSTKDDTSCCRRAFFRNITRWGATAEDFLRNKCSRYDLVAMAELHLAADELMEALHVFDSAGFHAAATPARPLGTFEKTGGVVAGVRRNFQSSTFRHLAAHSDQMLGAAKLPGLPLGPVDF